MGRWSAENILQFPNYNSTLATLCRIYSYTVRKVLVDFAVSD